MGASVTTVFDGSHMPFLLRRVPLGQGVFFAVFFVAAGGACAAGACAAVACAGACCTAVACVFNFAVFTFTVFFAADACAAVFFAAADSVILIGTHSPVL